MEPAPETVFVGWMPYLTLSYPHGGKAEYQIGRAKIVPDDDTHWKAVTGLPRPKHLDIHEDFPDLVENGLQRGRPLYGTLITSDDGEWLRAHIDAVTAAIFFLADFAEQVLPAECVTTLPLEIKVTGAERENDLISYLDKHSRRVESSRNLFLTPPIAVRGNFRSRRLTVGEPWAVALLALIASSPEHRLVVALRQYFRTQFSDPFTSPADEDFALHCSAIEAALDMDRTRGISERFAQALSMRFGNKPLFETFFLGLHKARSIFIHGLSVSDSDPWNKEAQALTLFRKTRRTLPLMRLVTQEVIRESLASQHSDSPRRHTTPAEVMLRRCLESDDIWTRLKQRLTARQAKEAILNLDEQGFEEIVALAHAARSWFDWQCVTERPADTTLFSALKTCALVICDLAQEETSVQLESRTVGTLAHAQDAAKIEEWIIGDPWRAAWPHRADRTETIQAIARTLAKAFDRHGVVRE